MTDPMTHEELQACRERAEAATPGPWEVSRRDDVMGGFDYFVEAGPLCVAVAAEDARPTRGMGAKRDAAFIAAAREDVPRLLATVAALESDLFRVAEVLGRVQYPDGHATYRGSVEDMVSRAEELTRAENTRGDAIAALSEHRHAALFAAGIRGGPGAWRWAHDKRGTTLDDAAAWERLLGEMRERSEADASHKALRWGVVANTINSASCAPRWVHVQRITGFGSTAARKLCQDAGFDPDENVGRG